MELEVHVADNLVEMIHTNYPNQMTQNRTRCGLTPHRSNFKLTFGWEVFAVFSLPTYKQIHSTFPRIITQNDLSKNERCISPVYTD